SGPQKGTLMRLFGTIRFLRRRLLRRKRGRAGPFCHGRERAGAMRAIDQSAEQVVGYAEVAITGGAVDCGWHKSPQSKARFGSSGSLSVLSIGIKVMALYWRRISAARFQT